MAIPFFGDKDEAKLGNTDAAQALKAGDSGKVASAVQDTASAGSGNDVIDSFASAATSQVAAMIGEDIRTFMQSMEQVYVAATAKALAMVADPDPVVQAAGTALLVQITTSQTSTTTFATGSAQVATDFAGI